jgi:hypothetical protein
MQNCHDLVQELVKRAKNCHQHGGPQLTFHSCVVNEEVANNINSFEDIFAINVFEITFTFIDLKK